MNIYGIQTGSVRIKKSHFQFEGLPSARFPMLLADWRKTPPLPVWVWVVEHPEGILVVDTGENVRIKDPDYLKCGGINGTINRTILSFDIQKEQEVGPQLQKLSIKPEDVRWVVLTHLHIDHTDGLQYFPKSEILVSKTEYQTMYGAVPCTFPKWFKPKLIEFEHSDNAFGGIYYLTDDIWLVPTPGHSFGHLSVLVKQFDHFVLLAGDASFTQDQVIKNKIGGINVDWKESKITYQKIKQYCADKKVIYMPSHDPESLERLENEIFFKI